MTATANIDIGLIDVNLGQKEVIANEAFVVIDAALSELEIDPGDANYTLSTSTTPQEWQYDIINVTGALTANRDIVVPTNKKKYTVVNATTGGFSVTLKTSGGTGIAVASTKTAILRCDGTNVVEVTPGAGAGTGSGDVTGPGSSTNNHFATFSGTTGKVIADSGLSLDTDTTLAANSDTRIASQKAVKAYADALIAANDAMVFKGVTDCSGNPNYPAADRGHTYRASVAGKIGGASGVNVEVGDMFMCLTDGTSAGAQGSVGSSWTVIQTNIDGAVVGPASSTDGNVVLMDGASGKLIKDSGKSLSSLLTESLVVACSDETTALTTGTSKITFRAPYGMTITAVRASLSTAQTSGSIFTVDINVGGSTILSTKLTIDNTEKTSTTATTAAVISSSSLSDDAEITIDIDQVGDGTAKGLKVALIGTRT